MVHLTDEEWDKVKSWLVNYRVFCNKESKKAKHEKICQYYEEISIEVRSFVDSKENEPIEK